MQSSGLPAPSMPIPSRMDTSLRSRQHLGHNSLRSNSFVGSPLGSWASSYKKSVLFQFDRDSVSSRRNASIDDVSPRIPEPQLGSFSSVHSAFVPYSSIPIRCASPELSEETLLISHEVDILDAEPQSTVAQTLFNSINILMGIGLLSLPFAFKLTGWVVGLTCLIVFALITRHTAILLSRCLDYDSPDAECPSKIRACTYGDMGDLAFGTAGRTFISTIFMLELFAACVALIILSADSIVALFPFLDPSLVKCVIVTAVLPLTLARSLHFVSWTSLMGIVALVNLLVIIVYNGLMTTESPGSLIVPSDTYLFPQTWINVPMSFGLIMAGFSGHSVFPNLYRDMKEPSKYPVVVNWSYLIMTLIYIGIGSTGYLMFGSSTMKEITENLPLIPSYNIVMTQVTVWLVAINPITKYPLAISPITSQLERTLSFHFPSLYGSSIGSNATRVFCVSLISGIILSISIVFPRFQNMMGLLGSFFSFTVSVLFPVVCYLKLFGRELNSLNWILEFLIIVIALLCGSLGTVWSFLYTD